MLSAFLSIVLSLAGWLILHFIRSNTDQRGKIEEQNKALSNMLDEVKRVKIARDNIADPNSDAAKFVRDKYTRPKP